MTVKSHWKFGWDQLLCKSTNFLNNFIVFIYLKGFESNSMNTMYLRFVIWFFLKINNKWCNYYSSSITLYVCNIPISLHASHTEYDLHSFVLIEYATYITYYLKHFENDYGTIIYEY